MKRTIIFILFISLSVTLVGQDSMLYKKAIPFDREQGLLYLLAKDACSNHLVLPQYSLGNHHLVEFLSSKMKYPLNYQTGELELIKGKLIASFLVTKSGKVENMKIVESPHQKVTEDITSAISKLKFFTPAKCDGDPIDILIFFTANFIGAE